MRIRRRTFDLAHAAISLAAAARIAILLILAVIPAFGGLIAPQSVPDLQQRADLIVVGTASGHLREDSPVFLLHITRVVKGDSTIAGSSLSVTWSNWAAGASFTKGPVTAEGAGLWFLRRAPNGWLLIPVVDGAVPLNMTYFAEPAGPILSAYSYAAVAPVTDKLAAELCSAIESLQDAYSFQLYALLRGDLDQLRSSVVPLLYTRMANSNVTQQQMLGLSGLIREGAGSVLATASQSASRFQSHALEYGILLGAIRDQFRSPDNSSISMLGQNSTNTALPLSFRESCAHALAAIHTAGALPYLASLFADRDDKLRAEAIGGMGSFANGLPIQTAAGVPALAHLQFSPNAPYRTNDTIANFAMGQIAAGKEAALLSFWERWWSTNKAALGF